MYQCAHRVVFAPVKNDGPYAVRQDLNERVSVWRGDITQLEVDAIVNAANSNLFAGGGGTAWQALVYVLLVWAIVHK